MSSAADLMRNELLTEVQDQTQKEREEIEYARGDQRLKPEYFDDFRPNPE